MNSGDDLANRDLDRTNEWLYIAIRLVFVFHSSDETRQESNRIESNPIESKLTRSKPELHVCFFAVPPQLHNIYRFLYLQTTAIQKSRIVIMYPTPDESKFEFEFDRYVRFAERLTEWWFSLTSLRFASLCLHPRPHPHPRPRPRPSSDSFRTVAKHLRHSHSTASSLTATG